MHQLERAFWAEFSDENGHLILIICGLCDHLTRAWHASPSRFRIEATAEEFDN